MKNKISKMSSLSVVLVLGLCVVVKSQEFQSVAAVQCFSPPSTGDCRARLPSFFFNLATQACDCFIFGGCMASGNIFSTLDACMTTCAVQPQLQTISSNCAGIFGNDNSKFTVPSQNTSPRPVSFNVKTTTFPSTTNRPPAATTKKAFNVKTTPFPSTTNRPPAATTKKAFNVKTTPFPSTTNRPPAATTKKAFNVKTTSTTAAPRPNVKTTAIPTNAPTTTRRSSAPSKDDDSTPGPWDHWLNP